MRKWIDIINEKWFATEKSGAGMVEIFINPSRSEYLKLMKGWGDEARGGIDHDGNLYLWHADHAFHDEVQLFPQLFEKMIDASLHFSLRSKDVTWTELEYYRDEGSDQPFEQPIRRNAQLLMGNPNITRAVGPGWKLVACYPDHDGEVTWATITPEWVSEHTEA